MPIGRYTYIGIAIGHINICPRLVSKVHWGWAR